MFCSMPIENQDRCFCTIHLCDEWESTKSHGSPIEGLAETESSHREYSSSQDETLSSQAETDIECESRGLTSSTDSPPQAEFDGMNASASTDTADDNDGADDDCILIEKKIPIFEVDDDDSSDGSYLHINEVVPTLKPQKNVDVICIDLCSTEEEESHKPQKKKSWWMIEEPPKYNDCGRAIPVVESRRGEIRKKRRIW